MPGRRKLSASSESSRLSPSKPSDRASRITAISSRCCCTAIGAGCAIARLARLPGRCLTGSGLITPTARLKSSFSARVLASRAALAASRWAARLARVCISSLTACRSCRVLIGGWALSDLAGFRAAAGLASLAVFAVLPTGALGALGVGRGGGAARRSGWRMGRFCARVGAGMAGPGVLAVAGARLSTASSACRSAGARSGLGVESLAGHMVGNRLRVGWR